MPEHNSSNRFKYAIITALVAVAAFMGGILFERMSNSHSAPVAPVEQQQSAQQGSATDTDTGSATDTGSDTGSSASSTTPAEEPDTQGSGSSGSSDTGSAAQSGDISRDGYYYDVESVVLYIHTYGELPPNYITKKEARSKGWRGGTPEKYVEGAAIGGDVFRNREGQLPMGPNYTECDIDTHGQKKRGAKRLIFSDDGHYYYTDDHYETFKELAVENGKVVWK